MLIREEQFAGLLKNGWKEHIFLIFGDDAHIKEVYVDRLVKAAVPDESLKFFNFRTCDDEETPPDDLFADADTLPVMSERRCMLVKNYPLNTFSEKALAEFEEKLRDVPESTVLVFAYPSVEFTTNPKDFPKWQPVIRVFSSCGVAAELSHRTKSKLVRMLMKGAVSRGATLSEDAALYLLDVSGEDEGNLLNEFNKLCAYADGREITREMIDETVTKSVEASVFDISTAILSKNNDRAYAIVFGLLRVKTPVQPILGALASTYVNLYRLKCAREAGRNPLELDEPYGYKGKLDYQTRKLSPFVGAYSVAQLRKAVEILLDADVTTKSQAFDPETLLTELIGRLASI